MRKFDVTPEMLEHNADSIPHWTDDLLELVQLALALYREKNPKLAKKNFPWRVHIRVPHSYLEKPSFDRWYWEPEPLQNLLHALCKQSILTWPRKHHQHNDRHWSDSGHHSVTVDLSEDLSAHELLSGYGRLRGALERHGLSKAEINALLRPFGA